MIKSFKGDVNIFVPFFGVFMFALMLYLLLSMSVSERAEVIYWGKLLMIENGSVLELILDRLYLALFAVIILVMFSLLYLGFGGKDKIDIYDDRLTMPVFVFPCYWYRKEIKFVEIKNISIRQEKRTRVLYDNGFWVLVLHLHSGKKYSIGYSNKRKADFDEIHELIKAHISPEAQLPPPNAKKKLPWSEIF